MRTVSAGSWGQCHWCTGEGKEGGDQDNPTGASTEISKGKRSKTTLLVDPELYKCRAVVMMQFVLFCFLFCFVLFS